MGIISDKSKSPFPSYHLINESANLDLSCPGDGLERIPGFPGDGDDHLHPLAVLGGGFASATLARSAPSVVLLAQIVFTGVLFPGSRTPTTKSG